ncbi:heme biosynthesis HemY N-terminal domain-containing protein [Orrella sp. JC864]|uniref:heme biosynthesis HemY N-terminal domain-containing protein n=1 Tax=Orrella sp. JC864 TaxID=3120298 RepID=UPI0012BCCC3D
MRTWFWTLLLAAVAVALAVFLREHEGNVLILVEPWRVQLSLTLAVLLLVATFIGLYVGLRLLGWLLSIPSRVRAWRGRRAQVRDHELLERGWIGFLEGRYAHAEKDLTKLLGQTRSQPRKVLAALSAARAAHGLGEISRRDALLDQALEHAGQDAGLKEAVATVAADLLLDQGQAQAAVQRLAPLQDGGVRHLHTQRLLLRAHHALGNHEQTFGLARSLMRRGVLAKGEGISLLETAAAERLRAGGDDAWRAVWKDLKADERTLPEVALAAAARFEQAGQPDEAARVLEAAVAARMDERLIMAYARCEPAQVKRRLAKAEEWLAKRPDDPDLLCVLGMLCLAGQLWGQAERYLLRSAQRRNDARVHALLGSLYDRLDRAHDAARHWRLATAAGMPLPVLASDGSLPAADMRSDPALLAGEGMDDYLIETPGTAAPAPEPVLHAEPPEAASASDYVLDPYARELEGAADRQVQDPAPGPAGGQVRATEALDEYFDSAPIPGVDFNEVQPEGKPGPDAPAEKK